MIDITQHSLDAALIDQMVAGQMRGRAYAFVPVMNDDSQWCLGVAVKGESGYCPISGKTFRTMREADLWAKSLNAHIGLSPTAAIEIIAGSMVRQ